MTTTEQVRDELIDKLPSYGDLLSSLVDDQVQLQVRKPDALLDLGASLAADRYYLVTAVANDEQDLEDARYKIYYMFSHPTADLFVMVEYLLDRNTESYPSLYDHFPAVDCFEREMMDLLGLRPQGARAAQVGPGSWLHESYPAGLHPLRRTQTANQLSQRAATGGGYGKPSPAHHRAPESTNLILPIGPIHAGVIEPGEFRFSIAGESIEDLEIRLGYAHRGIERLFQSHVDLLDGWYLAEQVSGDSSFAHSLAYCRAAERLTEAPVSPAAELLRALFLELERIHNHVADVAALAEDVALDRLSAEIAVIREQLLRLNRRLTGHRYLRRLNRPGGVVLPAPLDVTDTRNTLATCLLTFRDRAAVMRGHAGFRSRTIGVGTLSEELAWRLGVTGLTARASGVHRDSRWEHPSGAYGDAMLRAATQNLRDEPEARAGDVYARFLTRLNEVSAAHTIVDALLDRWTTLPAKEQARLLDEPRVLSENNYISAVGYAEGFRGDVVYWLMQDKLGGIYRCKIRDPSMLNWPALREAVLPHMVSGKLVETVLADFPLVNKSFNLSYAGNDL